jgi:hypothetical protein
MSDTSPILDAQVWQEGYNAARRGVSWAANPYPIGSVRALAWHKGFAEGRTKRLQMVKPCD